MMATKKASADKAEKKETKRTTTKKTTKPKAPEKKAAPEQPKKEAAVERPEPSVPREEPKLPAIIDDSDKILKSSDVELPPADPVGKRTIVVSHGKASKGDEDDEIEVIAADEVLKDLEYDFESHKIKPYTGKTMTSHEMHQGKYGIIDDVTKPKKRK